MEENLENYREPRYTMSWLGMQSLFILGVAIVFSMIAMGIDNFAMSRSISGLLPQVHYGIISDSITYCFAIISITSISLMLIEINYRKPIHYIQYILIGCALCLFNLLLLAIAEYLPAIVSYLIVTTMTIGLISLYVWGITSNKKATVFSAIILGIEYGIMLLLLYIGSMALLIGSLILFFLIGAAMYFTLKLKIENEELILK